VGIRCADHPKVGTSPTRGGRSVGIVRLRITATEFSFSVELIRGLSTKIQLYYKIVFTCVLRNFDPKLSQKGKDF
jgi:hypothetical protein